MTCAGNSTQFCGAGNRMNVYQATAAQSTKVQRGLLTRFFGLW
jgi:hypothetical protein